MNNSIELYPFQKQAIKELQQPNKHIVVSGVGCFTGDTKVRINSAKEGKQTTIKNLYLSWHGLNPHTHHVLKDYGHTYVRGWRNGRVGLNKIADVVCQGKKPILRLEFSDGTVIRCTPNHKFMAHTKRNHYNNEPDWVQAKDLLGCYVAKDNPHTKRTKRKEKHKDTYVSVPDAHPFARINHNSHGGSYKRLELHRAVYEANFNGFDDIYDWRDHIGIIPMEYVDPKEFHIHHKDHDHYNNDPENLVALPVSEHHRLHATPQNFHQGEVEYIRCTEIEYCGEETVYDIICEDVHSYTANDFVVHNSGKGSMALWWLKNTGRKSWLVVTTASKRDSQDFYKECDMWFGEDYKKSLSSFVVVSWQGLAKWVISNYHELDNYAIVLDEVQKCKAGVSSARGRAVLTIAKHTDCWVGFTATPGDRWIDFQAYFVAGGYIKNKTQFQREFCQIQTFKGYPEIVGYHSENILRKWWSDMTVCPDTSQMEAELPAERHYTYEFKIDPYYPTLMKTRTLKDGTFLDTTGAFCAAARRLCFTKQKQQWVKDYIEGLGTNAVFFYAMNDTGNTLENIIKQSLPEGARVWRICGGRHEIPTAETIGKYDVVVCQWEAGSEALNLQFMKEWVSVEPCYSYSTSQQARGRIRRIGQKQNMRFHYLMCPKAIEGAIYKTLRTKGIFAEEEWIAKEGGNNA